MKFVRDKRQIIQISFKETTSNSIQPINLIRLIGDRSILVEVGSSRTCWGGDCKTSMEFDVSTLFKNRGFGDLISLSRQ